MRRWIAKFVLRCRSLFTTNRVEAELDEELQFHLEQHIQAQVSRGVTPEEARRRAVIAIGGLDQQKDACRDTRGVTLIDHAGGNVRLTRRGRPRRSGSELSSSDGRRRAFCRPSRLFAALISADSRDHDKVFGPRRPKVFGPNRTQEVFRFQEPPVLNFAAVSGGLPSGLTACSILRGPFPAPVAGELLPSLLAQHLHALIMLQRLALANGHGWHRFLKSVDQVLPKRGNTLPLPLGEPEDEEVE